MNAADFHECRVCYQHSVPIWRAMCPRCFSLMPKSSRDTYAKAYRARVVEPREWQEMHIHWRQWFLENNTHDQREG